MDEKWARLEEIVRRVVREEIQALRPKEKRASSVRLEGRIWVGITEDQMEAWKAAYPSVDVEFELKKAAAWIVSNQSDAPKSQFTAFLNRWFARNQNDHAKIASRQTGSDKPLPASAMRKCVICGGSPNLRNDSGEWRCLAHRYDEVPLLRMVK